MTHMAAVGWNIARSFWGCAPIPHAALPGFKRAGAVADLFRAGRGAVAEGVTGTIPGAIYQVGGRFGRDMKHRPNAYHNNDWNATNRKKTLDHA